MVIYATAITILAVVLGINALKWKISTHAVIWFCKEHNKEPTEKEIADYTKRVISKMFKGS